MVRSFAVYIYSSGVFVVGYGCCCVVAAADAKRISVVWLAFRHSGGGSGDDNDKGGDGEGERVHERFSTWPQVVATTTTMKCRSALHKSCRHCRLGDSVEVRSTDDCAQHQIG